MSVNILVVKPGGAALFKHHSQTPSALTKDLRKFASRGYENDIVTMGIKILERNTGE